MDQQNDIDTAMMQADVERISKAGDAETAAMDAQRMQAIKREGALQRIAGELPDDAKALWMYAESSLTQAVISTIDAGRALIKLKAILPHGEFRDELEARGIGIRGAQTLIKTAAKFSNRSDKFMQLSRSQLFACLELSDDELDALEDGQSVLDMELDTMDRMTVRELKAAIKKRDADIVIKDELLESKNKMIDATAEENAELRGQFSTDIAGPAEQIIRDHGGTAAAKLILLRGMANRLAQEGSKADPNEVAALTGVLDAVRTELALAYRLLEAADPAYQACNELAGQEAWNPDIADAVN